MNDLTMHELAWARLDEIRREAAVDRLAKRLRRSRSDVEAATPRRQPRIPRQRRADDRMPTPLAHAWHRLRRLSAERASTRS